MPHFSADLMISLKRHLGTKFPLPKVGDRIDIPEGRWGRTVTVRAVDKAGFLYFEETGDKAYQWYEHVDEWNFRTEWRNNYLAIYWLFLLLLPALAMVI